MPAEPIMTATRYR